MKTVEIKNTHFVKTREVKYPSDWTPEERAAVRKRIEERARELGLGETA